MYYESWLDDLSSSVGENGQVHAVIVDFSDEREASSFRGFYLTEEEAKGHLHSPQFHEGVWVSAVLPELVECFVPGFTEDQLRIEPMTVAQARTTVFQAMRPETD